MKHNDWVRDPETGEYGQLKSLRTLLWEYVKPAYMWARFIVIAGGSLAAFIIILALKADGTL